jgi:hypothetical protein
VFTALSRMPPAGYAWALDQGLGTDASKIKRPEHIFSQGVELEVPMEAEGFEHVRINTITKCITFPSVLDYVRFQLIATPMTSLLSDRNDVERETVIRAIATEIESLLDPEMMRGGRFHKSARRDDYSRLLIVRDGVGPCRRYGSWRDGTITRKFESGVFEDPGVRAPYYRPALMTKRCSSWTAAACARLSGT